MYNRKLWFAMMSSLLALAWLAPARSLAVSNASLKGPYGVLLMSAADAIPANEVGVLDFDGEGNVTASFQTNDDGTLGSFTGSGTYSMSSNGAGSMSLVLSTGPTVGFALALQESGKQFQLMQSSVSGQSSVNEMTGTGISQEATSFTSASMKGTYQIQLTKAPLSDEGGGPFVAVGTMAFDGKGNIKSIALEGDLNGTVSASTGKGTYTVNSDGTGTAALVSNGETINFALVLNSLGKGFQLIEVGSTAGPENDVIGGSAGH